MVRKRGNKTREGEAGVLGFRNLGRYWQRLFGHLPDKKLLARCVDCRSTSLFRVPF